MYIVYLYSLYIYIHIHIHIYIYIYIYIYRDGLKKREVNCIVRHTLAK